LITFYEDPHSSTLKISKQVCDFINYYVVEFRMFKDNSTQKSNVYDVIVIGAGLCGIISLKYARDNGLNCLVLEKEEEAGGVWRWIPAWQDIQNRKQDFSINRVPLKGVKQPDIHQYIQEWVRKFDLHSYIRLSTQVISVSWNGEIWQVRTDQTTFQTRYLIVASGVQNRPWIPEVERSHSNITEIHSSELRKLEDLKNKRVTVVGGGASSWDLLDLAIQHKSSAIHWVYRNIRWFLPTYRKKHKSWPNIRELALVQTIGQSPERVNAFLRWLIKIKFDFFNLNSIKPDEPYDLKKHQLLPDRELMIRNLDRITRHQSEIRQITGKRIILKNRETIETDLILWATGFRMNLNYLGL
jgi:cation diffusion facilitator CzcD-associated flavoprotein CzcO